MLYLAYKQSQTGFTLLELVLVLFILAILTTTGLSFIESEDGQLRYEGSIKKKNLIVDNLYRELVDGDQKILSGYIIDNGMLPPVDAINDNANERMLYLLTNDANDDSNDDLLPFQMVNAYSDTNGTPQLLTDGTNNFSFFKGYRAGGYLRADNEGSAANQSDLVYKDNWGQAFFISDISANSITIGYDGNGELDFDNDLNIDETQLVKPTPFDTDHNIVFSENDWTIDRDQLHIVFTTNDGTCSNCDYTISVSVFRNNSTCDSNPEDCWDTYYFSLTGLSNGDSRDTTIDLPSWNHNGNGDPLRIPAGEHLAVVLDNAGDAMALTSARFKVFPNSTQPTVILTVP